jgi:hypothetical protein
MSSARLSHIAILVLSVERAAQSLDHYDFKVEPPAEWEGTGTKEIYIEVERPNSLLLMEPIAPGAYERAMKKRGPGLHHIGIDVDHLLEFVEFIQKFGWCLHPISAQTMTTIKTAWLYCPGFPSLIEVHERKEIKSDSLFIERLDLPLVGLPDSLLTSMGLDRLISPTTQDSALRVVGHRILLKSLF